MKRYAACAILALLGATTLGWADDMAMPMGKSKGGPADKAYAGAMRDMMKGMAVKPSGAPDRDFVVMMIPHHQGAIDMAKIELKYGKDPQLLKLASDIVAAQEREIAEMKAWLAK